MIGYRKWAKRVIWFSWRNWAVKTLFQRQGVELLGLLCFGGLGGVLLGMLPVMTPSMLKSLYLAMVGVTSFCHEGVRCGGFDRRTL